MPERLPVASAVEEQVNKGFLAFLKLLLPAIHAI